MGRRGGHIVNIGDVATRKAWPSYIPYTLSKAGIVALTRGLAVALRPQRIAVNCVAPGAVLRPESFSLARWRGGDAWPRGLGRRMWPPPSSSSRPARPTSRARSSASTAARAPEARTSRASHPARTRRFGGGPGPLQP